MMIFDMRDTFLRDNHTIRANIGRNDTIKFYINRANLYHEKDSLHNRRRQDAVS